MRRNHRLVIALIAVGLALIALPLSYFLLEVALEPNLTLLRLLLGLGVVLIITGWIIYLLHRAPK